jgi:type IV secretion system protein VirB9
MILSFTQAYAVKEAKPLAIDKRLGIIIFNPYDVHKFVGYYGYQSSIIFADDETIETMSMGDSTPWQMVPNGNRLFLKPIDQDATTNLTVITNLRTYYFELHAMEAKNINQDGLMFAVRFIYPDEHNPQEIALSSNVAAPDLSDKSLYNFEYTISGPSYIAPIKIFDDGKFTYFEFNDKNAELPAIFYVNNDGTEGVINYRVVADYLVVESIRARYSLRREKDVVCVFNEFLINKLNTEDKVVGYKK